MTHVKNGGTVWGENQQEGEERKEKVTGMI
jgi:hypothetical protein